MKELADRVRAERNRLGLTQEELAKRCGYKSRVSINRIEMDKYEVGLETVKKLAKALGVSPMFLIFGNQSVKDEIASIIDRLTPEQQASVLQFLRSMTADKGQT